MTLDLFTLLSHKQSCSLLGSTWGYAPQLHQGSYQTHLVPERWCPLLIFQLKACHIHITSTIDYREIAWEIKNTAGSKMEHSFQPPTAPHVRTLIPPSGVCSTSVVMRMVWAIEDRSLCDLDKRQCRKDLEFCCWLGTLLTQPLCTEDQLCVTLGLADEATQHPSQGVCRLMGERP